MRKKPDAVLSIKIPADVVADLDALAERETKARRCGLVTRAQIIREFIAAGLAQAAKETK